MISMIVYAAYSAGSDVPRYVGGTTRGFERRISEHKRMWRLIHQEGKKPHGDFQHWLAGEADEPEFSILDKCGSREELHEAEKRWIDAFAGTLTNGQRSGVRLDDVAETERANMRTSQRARRQRERETGTGYRLSEAQRRRAGEQRKAAYWSLSEEERAARIKARIKPKWGEASRAKIGEKGKRQWEEMTPEQRSAWSARVVAARAKAQIPRSCCVECRREMQTFQLSKHFGSRKCVQARTAGVL